MEHTTYVSPYLKFEGNCVEAMNFYKDCLGGELMMQKLGDTPMAKDMPGKEEKIMNSTLTKGSLILYGSDIMMEGQITKGNTIQITLNCATEEEINEYFAKLSAGGTVDMALEDTFWGARFGMLTDKYGFEWMLNYDKPKA